VSAMDGANESLPIRQVLKTRTLLRVFLCLQFYACNKSHDFIFYSMYVLYSVFDLQKENTFESLILV
tara:strand:- start:612 stop:812 length:201 start_codon:yes stop_codon:yes gene_type:complete